MNRSTLYLSVGLLLAGAAMFAWAMLRKPKRPPAHPDLEARNAALAAGMEAQGATPCETGYNALFTFKEEAIKGGLPSPWSSFPEKQVFMTACTALPEQEQLCMQPKYHVANRAVCEPILRRLMEPNRGTPTLSHLFPRATEGLPAPKPSSAPSASSSASATPSASH